MKWLKNSLDNGIKITLEDVIEKSGNDYPLLLELKKTEQDPDWHSEGNVHIHTNMVIDEMYKIFEENNFSLKEKYVLLMSAIFHDIAKPLTSKWKEVLGVQRLTAKGHEYEGMSYLSYKFLNEEMDNDERNMILELIGYHQLPKLFVVKESYNEWHYKILTENTEGKYFYFLELADMRGRITKEKDEQIEYMELFKMFCIEYDCFYTKSNIESELKNIFIENFKESSDEALSYLISKAKKRLFDNDIIDPLICYQKYYEYKNNHSKVFIMCGISGSGKSTLVNKIKLKNNVNVVIELDDLRNAHKQKNNNRREIDSKVRQEANDILKRALSAKENIIFDACNYRKDFRDAICSLVESYFGKTILVFVETPLLDCINNDKKRSVRTLGEEIIKGQEKVFQYPEKFEFNEVYKN